MAIKGLATETAGNIINDCGGKGIVRVSEDMVTDYPFDFMRGFMAKVIVLRAEYRYDCRCFEYTIWHPDLPTNDRWVATPQYNVILARKTDGEVTLTFEECFYE